MRFQEIFQDIIDAIRGGAGWDGSTKADGAVDFLDTYSGWLYDVITVVMDFFKSIANAFSK